MKKNGLLILMTFSVLSALAQTPTARIDSLAAAYSRVQTFSGSVLVAQKGTVLIDKGYGYRNFATHALNDSNSIFQVGSVTKQFTAAIILQLAEKKKLTLQDKLSRYIPGYPNGDSISIEHLLTHTAGVFNYTEDAEFMRTKITLPISRDSLIAVFKNKPLSFSPGSQFSYSNSNYILLGYIIEKITGKSYFQVVKENIFEPLHMTHSGFDFKDLDSENKAIGYATAGPGFKAPVVDSSVSFAAGSIYSTTGDLYKWYQALTTGRVLQPATLIKAFTPHLSQYGYGWAIGRIYDKQVIEHGGSIPGFLSNIRMIPEDDVCIIILDNHPQKASPSEMTNGITAILYDKPYTLPREHVEIHVDSTILRQYVGRYSISPQAVITITLENGQLYEQLTGQGRLPIFPEKENYFFLKAVDAQIEFVKAADNTIEKLILHQNGQDTRGLRLNP